MEILITHDLRYDPGINERMTMDMKNPMIAVFYGLGDGARLKSFLKQPHPKTRFIIIVEKSREHYQAIVRGQDWAPHLQQQNISWLIEEDPKASQHYFRNYFKDLDHLMVSNGIEAVCEPSVMARDGAYYLAMAQALKEGSQEIQKLITASPEDYYEGAMNVLDNLEMVATSPRFHALKNLFAGKPGVVVATGPSLDHALPYLKKIQDHVVLFACDSAVPILLKEGIRPHFVATLERVVATERLFEELPDLRDQSWLVTLPIVFNRSLQKFTGEKLFLGSSSFPYNWFFPDFESENTGHSAATLAFQGLNVLGCDPIILAGQDLAYDRYSERSHAKDAIPFLQEHGKEHRQKAATDKNGPCLGEGNNGQPILTNPYYQLFASNFENLIHETGRRCYNAIPAPYGLKIPSAHRVDPEAIPSLIQNAPFDARTMIQKGLSDKPKASAISVREKLEECHQGLEYIRDHLMSLLEEWSTFYHHNPPTPETPETIRAYEQECQKLEGMLNAIVPHSMFSRFLWPCVMVTHIRVMARYYELQGQDLPFIEKTVPLFFLWQEDARDMYYWAARMASLFQKKLKS